MSTPEGPDTPPSGREPEPGTPEFDASGGAGEPESAPGGMGSAPGAPPPPSGGGGPGVGGPETPGAAPGAGAPPKKGLSTGAKIAIGCGAVALLGVVLLLVAVAVGGWFLKDRAEGFVEGVERQAEVSERMERLQREHPFQPTEDGEVTERQAETFFAVTDRAWEEVEEWTDELTELNRRVQDRDRPGIRDFGAGMRGMAGFAESRVVLGNALVEHEMTIGEYLWTGYQLMRARDELDRDDPSEDVPPQNLELARAHRAELDEIARSSDGDRAGKGLVLQLATVWGMADGSTWQAFGLDTLQQYAR